MIYLLTFGQSEDSVFHLYNLPKVKEANMWKLIDGTHHHYIDEQGNVYNSMTRVIKTQWINKQTGYPMVDIHEFNSNKHYTVHRLLAKAFIPNPENKATVNHINGNRADNRLENLEWNTQHENNMHKCRVLKHIANPSCMTDEYAKEIYTQFMQHHTLTEIAKTAKLKLSQLSVKLKEWVVKQNLVDEYKAELKYQKALRAKVQGKTLSQKYASQRLSLNGSTPKQVEGQSSLLG
jgi:hypothetical protein